MIRLPYALIQWAVCAALKLALYFPSMLGVFLSVLGDGWRNTPWLWEWCADAQNTPTRYYSRWGVFYFWGIRNPVKMMVLPYVTDYKQYGDIDERVPGFQWRYRHNRFLDSFRCVWGEPRNKGKREFYIGWKLGSTSPNKFTVQFRPF